MISRATLAVDRAATLLLALALIAGGSSGIWWWSGQAPFASRTSTTTIRELVAADWWPWASATLGVVLILIGLRWIVAHLSDNRVKELKLTGSGAGGRLGVDATRVAEAAARTLAETVGVRSAKGRVSRDRGQIVAAIHATIEPDADLTVVAEQADLVSAQLAHVLGRSDLRCSVTLSVARSGRTVGRVS